MKRSAKTSRKPVAREENLVCQVKFRDGKLVAVHCEEAKKPVTFAQVASTIGVAADAAAKVARAVTEFKAAARR